MKMIFVKSAFLSLVLTCSFSLIGAAQTQQFKTPSAITEKPKVIRAKREIIKILLADFSKNNAAREIYLSTRNIPSEIQKEFPAIENLTTKLIAPEAQSQESVCPFEFRIFTVSGKRASVLFGNCNNGLGYTFQKSRGKWNLIPSEIINPK